MSESSHCLGSEELVALARLVVEMRIPRTRCRTHYSTPRRSHWLLGGTLRGPLAVARHVEVDAVLHVVLLDVEVDAVGHVYQVGDQAGEDPLQPLGCGKEFALC